MIDLSQLDAIELANEEAKYKKWLGELCNILKCPMLEEGDGSEEEAYRLYRTGITPGDAAVVLG